MASSTEPNSVLLKKKHVSGCLTRTRFAKPQPNVGANKAPKILNILDKKKEATNTKKGHFLPTVEAMDEDFSFSSKNETLSTSCTLTKDKEIVEVSPINMDLSSVPEEKSLNNSTSSIQRMEDTSSKYLSAMVSSTEPASVLLKKDTQVSRCLTRTRFSKPQPNIGASANKAPKVLNILGKKKEATNTKKDDLLPTVEAMEEDFSFSSKNETQSASIFDKEKEATNTKNDYLLPTVEAVDEDFSVSSMNEIQSTSCIITKDKEIVQGSVILDLCNAPEEKSLNNSGFFIPSVEDSSSSSENCRKIAMDESSPAVINDTTADSTLKNISNSPRKRVTPKKTLHRRERFTRTSKAPNRSEMKMVDLIHYNSDGAAMKYANSHVSAEVEDKPEENSPPLVEEEENLDSGPRVVIGENGEIIIDEASLVIRRKDKAYVSTSAVVENENTTYSSFRRCLPKKWTRRETMKFYKALSTVGTDFGLMEVIFNNWNIKRSRHELKLKFKREERHHAKLVFRAMYETQLCDVSYLDNDSDDIIDSSEVEDEPPKSNTESNEKTTKRNGNEESFSAEDFCSNGEIEEHNGAGQSTFVAES